jgi:hypothetical protein
MDKIRIFIVYTILWIMTIIAAFEGGIIYTSQRDIPGRITKLETNQKELSGIIESHKAILRGLSKGRSPQIP